jgi:MFS family permease
MISGGAHVTAEPAALEEAVFPAWRGLAGRNFLVLAQGMFISRLGAQITSLVMLLWLQDVTNSAGAVGLLAMLTGLPTVLFGIVGGSVADRHSRRLVIVSCDLIGGVAMAVVAVLFALTPGRTELLVVAVVLASMITATADAFSLPAINAVVPDIVHRGVLSRGNALLQIGFQLATLIGQGLAGVLYRVFGMAGVSIVNSCAGLWAGSTELLMRIPPPVASDGKGDGMWKRFISDTREGLRFVGTHRGLRKLLVASAGLNFLSAPLIVLLVTFYVSDVLHAARDWSGYLSAAYGAGALLGAAMSGVKELRPAPRSVMLLAGMAVQSVGFAMFPFLDSPPQALGLAFVGGAVSGIVGVHMMTILQVTTPAEIRGRVFGILATVAGGLAPLGMGIGGIVFVAFGQNVTAMFCGAACLMGLVVLLLMIDPSVRAFLRSDRPLPADLLFTNDNITSVRRRHEL